jgi:lysophospholipase L1-like esterase
MWLWRRQLWENSFPGLTVQNLGVNAITTDNLRQMILDGRFPEHHPKVVIILIGTNDIGAKHAQPDHPAGNIAEIVALIRGMSPASRILLVAPLPRGHLPNEPLREPLRQVGKLISRCADQSHITYADIGNRLVDGDGSISQTVLHDYLHPTDLGYEILADALRPFLMKALNDH